MTVHPLLRQAMASTVLRKYPMALVVLVAVIDGGMTTDTPMAIKVDGLAATLRAKNRHSVRRGLRWLVTNGYLTQHVAPKARTPGAYSLRDTGHERPYRRPVAVPPLADAA